MINILVADDDERILRLISDFLKVENYQVYTAQNGEEALNIFKRENISLLILDIMMPIKNGWEVCKSVREISHTPILILTAKDSDSDELFGFDLGADEYISKPFNPKLLVARVKNLLKRAEVDKDENIISYEGLILNRESHNLSIEDKIVELTPKEYELIELFLKSIDKVYERNQLLDLIWGYDYYGDPRTVDTHIRRLRKKLDNKSYLLKTIRGYGYKFGV